MDTLEAATRTWKQVNGLSVSQGGLQVKHRAYYKLYSAWITHLMALRKSGIVKRSSGNTFLELWAVDVTVITNEGACCDQEVAKFGFLEKEESWGT